MRSNSNSQLYISLLWSSHIFIILSSVSSAQELTQNPNQQTSSTYQYIEPNQALRGIDSRFGRLIANRENYETQSTELEEGDVFVPDNSSNEDLESLEGGDPENEKVNVDELSAKELKVYKKTVVEHLLRIHYATRVYATKRVPRG